MYHSITNLMIDWLTVYHNHDGSSHKRLAQHLLNPLNTVSKPHYEQTLDLSGHITSIKNITRKN
ncbi:hypothetical protein Lmor_2131 [Legionella moravica]|uniref:Uncharacterized protein n=1 Tax=Legionella moravica TaxID=39962 RepID=A0A378JRU2_9GAMM|nr:hypothetical protein Lmor_2131 [Legionella moravica]STX61425.1 Uncharacterised protein [Legionella moravica]